ncbi:MAG: hypothetical protein ACO4CS_03850 [bacterium]
MKVSETSNGFLIEWDPDDPLERVFNDWTEDDFMCVFMERAKLVLSEKQYISEHSDNDYREI